MKLLAEAPGLPVTTLLGLPINVLMKIRHSNFLNVTNPNKAVRDSARLTF